MTLLFLWEHFTFVDYFWTLLGLAIVIFIYWGLFGH